MRKSAALLLVLLGLSLTGCLNVRTPDVRVNVDGAEPVDPSRVPRVTSVEQGQAELDRAYAYIQSLEEKNRELKKERDEYKHERDKYKKEGAPPKKEKRRDD